MFFPNLLITSIIILITPPLYTYKPSQFLFLSMFSMVAPESIAQITGPCFDPQNNGCYKLAVPLVKPTLSTNEVDALKQIAETLGKKDWDFSVDPCSNESNWITPSSSFLFMNNVTCNCSFDDNTTCHIVSIVLVGQNLGGQVPPKLIRLPYLQEIDLSLNYLNGTIPPEWGTMQQLQSIDLQWNRVTGQIPSELASISTLRNINLGSNQLSGNIPPEFGNFLNMEMLILPSNNLTGELPASLANLNTLKHFLISDNNFSGSIPKFIEDWTSIETLMIQGSGLSGPIPSGIASMTNLSDLRITDLNGDNESKFPLLKDSNILTRLILRSCNVIGQLPSNIWNISQSLDFLDLSFNKLSGPIPDRPITDYFLGWQNTRYIYLTGNLLTGSIPTWMKNGSINIDLSYNNLTSESTSSNCQLQRLNLFASSKGNTTGIVSCLRSYSCEQTYSSLHINCGGGRVKDDDNGTTFEMDNAPGGPSNFGLSGTNWGFSSTGHYTSNIPSYIKANTSSISGKNPQLYMDARVSPLSLSYYGFCLGNGNYTIYLHFAEIMFTDDKTFSSLGRRIFDVYIQGQRVLKDFNIKDEAGGVNIGIVRNFSAAIIDNTLDIRFYWAGKGITGYPIFGVYGPLISAISVINPDFPEPSENGKTSSVGAITIVIAVLFTVLLVLSILWWKGCLRPKNIIEQDLKGLGQHTGIFTLRKIRAATNNFDPANKIGEGGFGPVYKGCLLSDGTVIAVKQLSSKSKQGNREFVNEIGMISGLKHPHLVKLYGCCIEGNQLLLVYEYMENNSLARALFSEEKYQSKLDWPTRHNICIGIARGLAYLHEESRLKIVHRDIKATNVLLDKNFNAKISDFGLAKLDEEDNTHISTRIAGTLGYMAPEYAMRGYLTDKADVYSYGVVLLEIVSGRSNTSIKLKEERFYLLDWANSLKVEGKLMELVDPRLESNFNDEEVITTINLALCCTNVVAGERPSMSAVVNILEGRACVEEFVSNSSVSIHKMKAKEITSQDQDTNSSISVDKPWTSSSKSISDMYPIILDTDNNWENFESLT